MRLSLGLRLSWPASQPHLPPRPAHLPSVIAPTWNTRYANAVIVQSLTFLGSLPTHRPTPRKAFLDYPVQSHAQLPPQTLSDYPAFYVFVTLITAWHGHICLSCIHVLSFSLARKLAPCNMDLICFAQCCVLLPGPQQPPSKCQFVKFSKFLDISRGNVAWLNLGFSSFPSLTVDASLASTVSYIGVELLAALL